MSRGALPVFRRLTTAAPNPKSHDTVTILLLTLAFCPPRKPAAADAGWAQSCRSLDDTRARGKGSHWTSAGVSPTDRDAALPLPRLLQQHASNETACSSKLQPQARHSPISPPRVIHLSRADPGFDEDDPDLTQPGGITTNIMVGQGIVGLFFFFFFRFRFFFLHRLRCSGSPPMHQQRDHAHSWPSPDITPQAGPGLEGLLAPLPGGRPWPLALMDPMSGRPGGARSG